MKLLLLSVACVCLIASLHAAAVESVVADEAPVGTESATAVSAMHPDCQQPKEVGRCFALFHRFAYNAENGECEEFIYGGCGGNTNNFKTKEMCAEKCLTVDAPPTEGPSSDEADAPVASS